MESFSTALELPTSTLVVLGLGYVGYRIISVDRRGGHKFHDVLFISLGFGLIARLLVDYFQKNFAVQVSILISAIVVIVIATVWRKFIANELEEIFRRFRVHNGEVWATAWHGVSAYNKDGPISIVVKKIDGTSLMFRDMSNYANQPHGGLVMGADGSVAGYANLFRASAAEEWVPKTTKIDNQVYFTVVPASQIVETIIIYGSKDPPEESDQG